jgi:hypothetical protein
VLLLLLLLLLLLPIAAAHQMNALRITALLGGELGRVVVVLGQRLRRQAGYWQTNDHGHSLPCGLLWRVRGVYQVTWCLSRDAL